ncbi:unnamed protein product [Diatraea saccharalis]|uniref:Uncharacterized protein n=1 Tax=Diatraea saccharalis TaxID=40085 RepID=A0A9N9RH47_9NEOP|nr:unnamed protein product [Diatraea saccharalis]
MFYVFYEQYLTIWADTFKSIGYYLIAALVFNLLPPGFNFLTTFAVMFKTIMIVLNIMGVMYIWNIPLNAVSCVNLIVSIGIGVEFGSHLAYASATSQEPPNERVFTNIPVIVLAFSYSQVIEVFFFRMFFSLVIFGLLYGIIFFSVFLSYLNDLFMK